MTTDADQGVTADKIGNRIRLRINGLSPSLVRVLEFIDTNRLDALTKSAAEIGSMAGTSDATVIRAVRALGYDGLNDLKRELQTTFGQGQTAADNMARTLSGIGDTQDEAIESVFRDHQAAIDVLASSDMRSQLGAAARLLSHAQRVGVFGLGPSSHVAKYFALQLTRSGRVSHVFDGNGASLPDQLLNMQDVDVVVMLAYGRPYKEATACIAEARRLRKRIILISDSDENGLANHATLVVSVLRGRSGRVAIHGATLVCLEAITLALAQRNKERSVTTLQRLNELRKSVNKQS